MTTLLLGFILAQNALAAEPADCAQAQVIVAQHDVAEAKDAYRNAHHAFYAVDWKHRLAIADDRDAVLAERERRWEEVKALRGRIAERRTALRQVKAQAAEGVLACDTAPSENEASAQADASRSTRAVR